MPDFSGLPLVIESSDLLGQLDAREHLILVDLTSAARYAEGHIPGAHFVDPKRTQLGQAPAPGLLPHKADLEKLFGELGHTPDATYVVYDDEGGGWAGRFIWLLDVIGHQKYHYLDGGLLAWLAHGQHPLSTEAPAPVGGPVEPDLARRPYRHPRIPAKPTWRGRPGYLGRTRPPGILRRRSARSQGRTHPRRGELRMDRRHGQGAQPAYPPATCRRFWKTSGLTKDKEIITHCQTHHRSGFTYLVAKALGYPRVKGYAGSWGEWGNHPDTPV